MHNWGTRRWNYFKDRLIERFGGVVYKVGVDAGFTCPNRDGVKAFGGCAYCSQEGSLSPHQDPALSIKEQLLKGMSFCRSRYNAHKFIAYFQSFTNTYDKLPVLKERFEAALIDPDIVGLSIASRPDCINEEHIKYLAELNERLPYFAVELGLQSVYQNRLGWVNRQESTDDYIKAMELLNSYKIPVISHIILGFPGESVEEMQEAVQLADDCKTYGIKLQMLHVIAKTRMAHIYKLKPFELFSEEEYIEVLLYMVEHLDPNIEIHRITGETNKSQLVAPEWVGCKPRVINRFNRELELRDTWQGKLSSKAPVLQSTENINQIQL